MSEGINLLGKDIFNKILTICVNDLDSIKQVSNVTCHFINNYTIPHMIGDFLGKLNKDVVNMIFIECYKIDEGKTVGNFRSTCKYIDNFFKSKTIPSMIRIMEDKRTLILNGLKVSDVLKDIIRPMIIIKDDCEEEDEYADNDGDYFDDDYWPKINKKCKFCKCSAYKTIVIRDEKFNKIYCYKCFLDNSFISKATPPPIPPIDPANNLHIYATNYNILRIMSGMGGLSYSN